MKFFAGLSVALLFSLGVQASPVCQVEFESSNKKLEMDLPLMMVQHPEADIVAWTGSLNVEDFSVTVTQVDGHTIVNLVTGDVYAHGNHEGNGSLTLGTAHGRLTLTCP